MKKNMRFRFPKLKVSISFQISIFLVIIAFIPVVVMMALKTYEKQQLEMLESSNVQQGRLVASFLSTAGVTQEYSNLLLSKMNGEFVSRIRILDKDARLLSDSAVQNAENYADEFSRNASSFDENRLETKEEIEAQKTFVYRLFSLPVRIYRKLLGRPSAYENADFYNGKKVFDGAEIQSALNGKYGAVTRISSGNQVSVTLYSAVPVKNDAGQVEGVVLVSRSTYRILRNLYELRRDLAMVFLKSLVAVILIAVFFAFRISVPLKKLSSQAMKCADKKGKIFFTDFTGSKRVDEIGELSRSFSSLIQRLNKRIQFSQAFSSDISHEFKNPLTVIRSSAELLNDTELDEQSRNELSEAIVSEVNHLQMLLTGVRNISKIDAGEELSYEPIPVNDFLQNVIIRIQKKYEGVSINYINRLPENYSLKIPEDYFDRIAENLIDNGASFGSVVNVISELDGGKFVLRVEDNGKGINPDSLEKVFERFYSEREETQKQNHAGLGLSTVKAITDSLEGEVMAGKSSALGGACFTIKINC